MAVTICQIVAMNHQRVIGIENRLPWHLPADLQHFKKTTLGKPIVMGRKTWESLGRPLPGRENIVITRQSDFVAEGAHVCASLGAALELASEFAEQAGLDEVMVIGGAQIYAESLPLCQRLYLTEVDYPLEGDAHYPELDLAQWMESSRECYNSGDDGAPKYCFVTLERNPT
ncbi:dihydrofolate reductase [Spongiibacter sp. KMU-158]|uniref:Dihydrofolate reductase n=1 Tax=Spongiibacter pelagi TaxID=2760804 RepID=A0A927GV05_9GAMM|nr:dihydrofolate reductase [Spongiibacter pelagi]MBD2857885.1 dihydrofolate reductase [Spongiibacter pelagi]